LIEKDIQCYNCTEFFSSKEITKEHIPAQSLFEGLSDEYKTNRITVPSCFECNNGYSKADEEFRNLIGSINKYDHLDRVSAKTSRSVLRKSGTKRLLFDNSGKIIAVEFEDRLIKDFHIKNFKGVFYKEYGYSIPNSYKILVNIDENDWSKQILACIGYLKNNFLWKYSGHEDVFKYIIQPFREGVEFNGEDFDPIEDEPYFIALLDYNKLHAAIVPATNQEIKRKWTI